MIIIITDRFKINCIQMHTRWMGFIAVPAKWAIIELTTTMMKQTKKPFWMPFYFLIEKCAFQCPVKRVNTQRQGHRERGRKRWNQSERARKEKTNKKNAIWWKTNLFIIVFHYPASLLVCPAPCVRRFLFVWNIFHGSK